MISLPSRSRVPPSVLLVSGVPAAAAALGTAVAGWLVAEASGGLAWWALPAVTGALWWAGARETAWLAVEVTRDVRAWRSGRAAR